MSRFEDQNAPRDVAFRQPGTRVNPTFKCAQCSSEGGMMGRRLRVVRSGSMKGLRAQICGGCVKANEEQDRGFK